MSESPLTKILQLTASQNAQKKDSDEKIKQILDLLKENGETANEIEDILPSAKTTKKEKSEKDRVISEKQKELIELQNTLISLRERKQPKTEKIKSWEPISIVANKMQELVSALSEQAIDEKTTSVPILSIFKVNNALNQLYEQCTQYGYIEETPELKQHREELFSKIEKEILDKLSEHVKQE